MPSHAVLLAGPLRTPQHQESPQTWQVLPLPGCGVGPWGRGWLGAASAEGVKPPAVRREPDTIPLQPGRGFQSNSPKYVYNFLFQKGSFLFKLGPETFQGA